MSFYNTIIKENSPKWWTLLILKSRIKKCYKRSKHTWVFLFSLTGADCCCVGALNNILTVVKWRCYVVSQYLILRRKAEKCGAEKTLSDLQVLPSENLCMNVLLEIPYVVKMFRYVQKSIQSLLIQKSGPSLLAVLVGIFECCMLTSRRLSQPYLACELWTQ